MTSPLQDDIAKLRETSRLRIIGLPSDTLSDALEARTEALKWYADPKNKDDGGEIARTALEEAPRG
jgi:hypothetical protein